MQHIQTKNIPHVEHPELARKTLSEMENGFILGTFEEKPQANLHVSAITVTVIQ